MKKLILSALALTLGLSMSAKVYYLLPGSAEVNAPVTSVYDYLPYENDGLEEGAEVSPERRAYEYLKTLNADVDRYITIKDLVDNALPADMTTLWVNIDRNGLSLGDFDAMFDDDVTAALGNFSKAGGNLFLSKQATRLVTKMGRAKWWPNDYQSNGYFGVRDDWQMCVHFCTNGNIEKPFHAALKYMENGQKQDGLDFITRFPMVSGDTIDGKTYRRSDNNCAWGDFSIYSPCESCGPEGTPGTWSGCAPERRAGIENGMNCKVLGGWGHTRGLDYAGMIEFYPTATFTGRIIVNGLAAYQWGPQNLSEYNVKNLTKGILEYLDAKEVYTREVTVGNYGTLCLPYDATVENAVLFRVIDKAGESDAALESITMEELESNVVLAGHSYIFRSTATPIKATMKAAYKLDNPLDNVDNGLFGNFVETTVSVGQNACYLIVDNQLRHVEAEGVAKLAEYRAHIGADWINRVDAAPGRPVVVIPAQPIVTGVETTNATKAATKALVNGKLVIVRGNKTYDVNGKML